MSEPPQVLVLTQGSSDLVQVAGGLEGRCQLKVADTLEQAVAMLRTGDPTAICVPASVLRSPAAFVLEMGGLLGIIPEGLVVIDSEGQVVWSNEAAQGLLDTGAEQGGPLAMLFGENSELLGPDFSPLNTALGSGESTHSIVRRGEKQYLDVTFTPVMEAQVEFPSLVLVTIRDRSRETLQEQKLNAIIQAGIDLGDLQPEDVIDLSVEDRIELLKSKLLYYTQDLLEFETVEIRIVEHGTGRLKPLLSLGMQPDAQIRELYAQADRNGVTGFVAATGRSYLCEDTTKDPLYLPGAAGAKSSLTVPLVLNEQVLGTFNVESPVTNAFTEVDLQYLEMFCREVAIALNTLDLLAAEKVQTLAETATRVLCEVADPVDEILNDASWVLERFGGDTEVQERLRRILRHTQEIRQQIHKSGECLVPDFGRGPAQVQHPLLKSKRILVADGDRDIRRSAHEILGRFGCIIETAHDGEEALRMARTFHYDVVLADIRLPDVSGSQIYRRMKDVRGDIQVILTTVFGYDAGHSLVKARQMGMKRALFKPFRTDQLVSAVEELLVPPTQGS